MNEYSSHFFLTRIVESEKLGVHGDGIVLNLDRFSRSEEGRSHSDKEDQKQACSESLHDENLLFWLFFEEKENYELADAQRQQRL